MAEYLLSPAAEKDIESIWRYTRQHWSAAQADGYTGILVSAFEELAQSPKDAPSCDHIRRGYCRQHVERHTIYFQLTDDCIIIVRVLHDRMDAKRHL
jgi:toxin ParE1/3/4